MTWPTEELDKALHDDAVTDRNIRLAGQGAFYKPLEEPATYDFKMEAFQRSARAIAARRERTAALIPVHAQRKALPPFVRYPT